MIPYYIFWAILGAITGFVADALWERFRRRKEQDKWPIERDMN